MRDRITPDQIKALRARLDMTQEELADAVGTYGITVSRWENGHHAPLPIYVRALRALERTLTETVA